jgi:hypothetical protein
MAWIIKSDDTETEVKPKNGKKFSLPELQKAVGGYIEIIPLDRNQVMYVNEDGRSMGLPTNGKATMMVLNRARVALPNGGVVGDVIVGSRKEMT